MHIKGFKNEQKPKQEDKIFNAMGKEVAKNKYKL